jgi:hypothetical protein
VWRLGDLSAVKEQLKAAQSGKTSERVHFGR